MYSPIRHLLEKGVPYAHFTGVEVLTIECGAASTRLKSRKDVHNHIQTIHAGALFTLGETASAAAMASAIAPVFSTVLPVAATASIQYLKKSTGDVTAFASTESPPKVLLATLKEVGKIQFPVTVDFIDAANVKCASMTVEWHVRILRKKQNSAQ